MSEVGEARSTVGDAADERWAKLRQQLRDARDAKGYTNEDVAHLARISLRSVYSLFSGEQMSRIDTVMRVALVVGARIELDFSEKMSDVEDGEASPLPALEPKRQTRSTGSRTSSHRSIAAAPADITPTKKPAATKKPADQRRKDAPKGGENWRYNVVHLYLRNHRRVTRKAS